MNEIKNTTFHNLWDAAKVVLIGKFLVIQSYLKTQEKSQITDLIYHLKELEKEQSPRSSEGRK